MDDLWLLSVKLMNSKKVKVADGDENDVAALEVKADLSEPPTVAGDSGQGFWTLIRGRKV